MQRLDLECAIAAENLGRDFSKNEETLVADAASVLASQGLYAFAVYLRSKKDHKAKDLLLACGKLVAFLNPQSTQPLNSENQVVVLVRDISSDLSKLLLAKRLVAETLAYLKYHMKSKPGKPANPPASKAATA